MQIVFICIACRHSFGREPGPWRFKNFAAARCNWARHVYIQAMQTLVVFAHGKESGPWGSKIKHLAGIARQLGAEVLSPDYSDLPDPDARVARLQALPLPAHERLVLVGSSMGGYVSTVATESLVVNDLFLMAPAFYLPDYAVQDPRAHARQISVVHGWHDSVVPPENSLRFAQAHRASLHLLDSDHRLQSVLMQVGQLFEAFLHAYTRT